MFYDDMEMLTIPKKEKWTGAQIYQFIDDIQPTI